MIRSAGIAVARTRRVSTGSSLMLKLHQPPSSWGSAPCKLIERLKKQPSDFSRSFSTTSGIESISSDDRVIIDSLAQEHQTSVSLQALMRTGRGEYLHKTFKSEEVGRHAATELVLMQVAGFLRRELPIRMAHRVADLEGVPVLKEMKSVQSVKEAYMQSILEIHTFDDKIDTIEKEEEFSLLIEKIYERHATVLVQSKCLRCK